jgi:hypothetical protein
MCVCFPVLMPAAHGDVVRGIACDALGALMATCSRDGTVRFWDAARKRLVATHELGCAATGLALHRESAMLAVVSAWGRLRGLMRPDQIFFPLFFSLCYIEMADLCHILPFSFIYISFTKKQICIYV